MQPLEYVPGILDATPHKAARVLAHQRDDVECVGYDVCLRVFESWEQNRPECVYQWEKGVFVLCQGGDGRVEERNKGGTERW